MPAPATAAGTAPADTPARRLAPQPACLHTLPPLQALVQFKRGATPTDKARALGRGGAVKQETVGRGGGGGELVLARFPSPPGVHRSTAKAAKEVESDESVEFVEVGRSCGCCC